MEKFIIFSSGDYVTNISMAGVDTLEFRREPLTKRFFRRRVIAEESCLHCLLPD